MQLLELERIWDRAPHNAFPDLIRHAGHWWCACREGETHVSPDGVIRILRSADGRQWEPVALLRSADSDLRDPKLSVAPDGELRVYGAEAMHDCSAFSHHSLVWRSRDGRDWSDRRRIGEPGFWIWRVSWHAGRAYGIGYSCRGSERLVRLYDSDDGLDFRPLVPTLVDTGGPNESVIVFEGETARCLLRRDGEPNGALLGTAMPPYTRWDWQNLGVRIGGPHMLRLADGRYLAGVRLYDGAVRTALCELDLAGGRLIERLALPSGGDTSYAGMAEHDGLLWLSYYSSHEEKTAIYLARVDIGA